MSVKIEYDPHATGSLSDLRVLDLSRLVSGNAMTHMLADHGAEVIKVERPSVGDDLRHWKTAGVSTHWKVYCRNKKSITLDLRQSQGREILLKLVESADILVENFKPGTLERWNIAPKVLHQHNAQLVVVRISGWGQSGLYSHKPGFGSLVEAMSGYASMNGYADRPPVLPPLALADMIAGQYGAFAALVAVRHIELAGGLGQTIDLPLFDPIFSILGPTAANYRLTGESPRRMGSLSDQTAPRNVYECKDGGHVALSASMQQMAERLFAAIGQPELVQDARFATNTARVANNTALDRIIAEFMYQHDQNELLRIFEQANVTVGPVADIGQLMDHPYINDRALIVDLPDAQMPQGLPMHNVMPAMSQSPAAIRTPAPALGEHNQAIFTALGMNAESLGELAASGII